MPEREIEIVNKLGLHARAAAKLVKLSATFESDIEIGKQQQYVNCKSIMGVMMLAASCGSSVTVRSCGNDEDDALQAICELIEDRFGENE